jgi:exopolysaccharide production protein ExoZ
MNKSAKLPTIQALRGVAALLVLGSHLTGVSNEILKKNLLNNFFYPGYSGVDFFFVLSGFIIFYIHSSDIGIRGKFKPFLVKRFIRVYPIYLLITLAVLPIYLSGYGSASKTNIGVIIKSLLLLPQDKNVTPILNVGWTLSYEALFYLLFSLTILIGVKYARILVAGWVVAILLLFWSSFTHFFTSDNVLLNFVFNTHCLEFLFGCLVAYIVKNFKFHGSGYTFFLGIFLFTLSFLNTNLSSMSHIYDVFAFGIPASLMIFGASTIDINKMNKIPRTFTYLGDASYSIYLTHFVAVTALMIIFSKLNLFSRFGYSLPILGVGFSSVVFGCMVFNYIESPLLSKLKRLVQLS